MAAGQFEVVEAPALPDELSMSVLGSMATRVHAMLRQRKEVVWAAEATTGGLINAVLQESGSPCAMQS